MFDKLKNIFSKEEVKPTPPPVEKKEPKPRKPRKPKEVKEEAKLSEKDLATQRGDPYVSIIRMDLDPNDVNNGAFELDWNPKFIANLVRAGYQIKPNEPESAIVDRWFQTVCRNVALEVYEQEQADPSKRDDMRVIRTRDLGDGRTEVS